MQPGDASDFPPVILVHGSRTSRTMWRAQEEVLARAGVPALACDLPGHGARRGEPFTLDGAVDAVANGIDDLGGRALVVGLSLGGYVAIEARARRPRSVLGLVAASCSTAPSTRLRGAWLLAAERIERFPDGGAALNQALVDRTLSPQAAADLGAGGFALDVMSAILRDEPARVSTIVPITPAGLDELIHTCLAKDPNERWQGMGDVARQLRWLQSGLSSARPPSSPCAMRLATRRSAPCATSRWTPSINMRPCSTPSSPAAPATWCRSATGCAAPRPC